MLNSSGGGTIQSLDEEINHQTKLTKEGCTSMANHIRAIPKPCLTPFENHVVHNVNNPIKSQTVSTAF